MDELSKNPSQPWDFVLEERLRRGSSDVRIWECREARIGDDVLAGPTLVRSVNPAERKARPQTIRWQGCLLTLDLENESLRQLGLRGWGGNGEESD